jgi:DNA adenine methylase
VNLARATGRASARGTLVKVSNTYCPEEQELYGEATDVLYNKTKAIGHAAKDLNRRKQYLIVLDSKGRRKVDKALGRFDHRCP